MLIALEKLRDDALHNRGYETLRANSLDAANEIERLHRRVTVLEQVIREDLRPDDCSDEPNRMIVEGVHEMKISHAERHPAK